MKGTDLKKTHTSKKALRSKLLTSLKRALRIGAEPRSTSNLQISGKGLPDTFLTYDELRKMNAQLLKSEMQKAEAIRLIREKNRCL
jgi:hypothetical protein